MSLVPIPVFLDHDGGHDDLVALALLLGNADKVKVVGCTVTDADCFKEHAFNVTGKLMTLMHMEEGVELFPIGVTSFSGVNPFPSEWRWSAKNMEDLPCVNIPKHDAMWSTLKEQYRNCVGEELLANTVMQSEKKVTICVTGPLSSVAWCIDKYGEQFTNNVEACVIMGGAVDVKGNVFEEGRDGSAEWNIYWDPPAAETVFSCPSLKKVVFSLDSTNSVPVISSVVRRFGAQNDYLLSQFVGSAWASCTHYEVMRPDDCYYAWDVLTAAYVVDPQLAVLDPVDLRVVVTKSAQEGRSQRIDGHGNNLLLVRSIDRDGFYELVYASMKKALCSECSI
nr:purine nucleosidase [Strigomonas culicis]